MPGPIPRSSLTRPARTSLSTGAAVPRISSAARRYARIVYGFASASSSSDAKASRRSAMAALSTRAVCPRRRSPRTSAKRRPPRGNELRHPADPPPHIEQPVVAKRAGELVAPEDPHAGQRPHDGVGHGRRNGPAGDAGEQRDPPPRPNNGGI